MHNLISIPTHVVPERAEVLVERHREKHVVNLEQIGGVERPELAERHGICIDPLRPVLRVARNE